MTAVKVAPSLVKALKVIKLNRRVTPEVINNHMGNEYASKHVCALRKLGFEFETEKDGRKIVAYKLVSEPDNVEEIRNPSAKEKPVKAPKTPKAPKAKADAKDKNLEKLKEIGKKQKAKKVVEVEEDEEDETEVVVSSPTHHTVDEDFDSLEGVDLKELIG